MYRQTVHTSFQDQCHRGICYVLQHVCEMVVGPSPRLVFFFFPFPPSRFPLACFSSEVGLGSLGWVCPSSLLEGEMLSVFFISGFGRNCRS